MSAAPIVLPGARYAGREVCRALDHGLELADVAGPTLGGESRQRFVGELQWPLHRQAGGAQEVAGQHVDVVGMIAQRGQRDGELGEPVVEIRAEAARSELELQVAMRGCDHPHVQRSDVGVADPLELAAIEDAQQLRLQLRREFADLVEQQRTAIRTFEGAGVIGGRARERTLAVAQDRRLRELAGDRAAVQHLERALAPRRLVERPRDLLFTGASLAEHQHRERQRGGADEQGEQLTHAHARRPQAEEGVGGRDRTVLLAAELDA